MYSLPSNKEISGIGIVAGTAIGASMLALPFETGVAGFGWACASIITCYFAALATLFLFLEVTSYCKDPEANIISMAHMHLGRTGELIAWVCYLLLLYTVATSYITGGGELISNILEKVNIILPSHTGFILFTSIFGIVAFQGISLLDKINQLLIIGMFASYLGLIFCAAPNVELAKLSGGNVSFLAASIPTTYAAFACHFVVPSLRKNFSNDITSLKKMILYGCTVPLVTYIFYEFLIVSLLPYDGDHGLLAIAQSSKQLDALQKALTQSSGNIVPLLMNLFQNCAILTSFLGLALALSDFLQDGLNLKGKKNSAQISTLLTLGPPLVIASIVPSGSRGFVIALQYSGLLVAFLFGVLPVLMAYTARYRQNLTNSYVFPGGKKALALLLLLNLGIMFNVIAETLHWLPSPRA